MTKKKICKENSSGAVLLVTMVMTGCGKVQVIRIPKRKKMTGKAEVTKEETKSAGMQRTDRIFVNLDTELSPPLTRFPPAYS